MNLDTVNTLKHAACLASSIAAQGVSVKNIPKHTYPLSFMGINEFPPLPPRKYINATGGVSNFAFFAQIDCSATIDAEHWACLNVFNRV